jgi:hypothetical protein
MPALQLHFEPDLQGKHTDCTLWVDTSSCKLQNTLGLATIAALTESPQHAAVRIGWHSGMHNHSTGRAGIHKLLDTHTSCHAWAHKEVHVHKHAQARITALSLVRLQGQRGVPSPQSYSNWLGCCSSSCQHSESFILLQTDHKEARKPCKLCRPAGRTAELTSHAEAARLD